MSLCKWMKSEAIYYQHTFGKPIPMAKLVEELVLMMQPTTMGKKQRPYGVGLVLAGVDELGPHVFAVKPDATYTENYAWAMGTRAQGAKTFLEKSLDDLPRGVHTVSIEYTYKEMDPPAVMALQTGID